MNLLSMESCFDFPDCLWNVFWWFFEGHVSLVYYCTRSFSAFNQVKNHLGASWWRRWYLDSLGIVFGGPCIFQSNGNLISLTWVHLGAYHHTSIHLNADLPYLNSFKCGCACGFIWVCAPLRPSGPGLTQMRPSQQGNHVLNECAWMLIKQNDHALWCLWNNKLTFVLLLWVLWLTHVLFNIWACIVVVVWWCQPEWSQEKQGSLRHGLVYPGAFEHGFGTPGALKCRFTATGCTQFRSGWDLEYFFFDWMNNNPCMFTWTRSPPQNTFQKVAGASFYCNIGFLSIKNISSEVHQ